MMQYNAFSSETATCFSYLSFKNWSVLSLKYSSENISKFLFGEIKNLTAGVGLYALLLQLNHKMIQIPKIYTAVA